VPGQESGQASSGRLGPTLAASSGLAFDWADFVDTVVAERGSLALAAQHLAERRNFEEDVASVERGLRRLRDRGNKDGGVWGQRALRCFGLPAAVGDRIRWMGQYHTRFTDLPASLCDELLRPWDRPPVSETPARIWLLLGHASLALRRRQDAQPMLEQAALLAGQAELAARIELALVESYAWGRSDPAAARDALDRAETLLEHRDEPISPNDHACLFARWIDQEAYPLNKPGGSRASHEAAAALYERIPLDGPLFARCRRENGLGWTHLQLGDRERAREHAIASVRAAGDAGSLRLRAMALNLLAACTEGAEADDAKARAREIARQLEDEALLVRFGPQRGAA
jgi:tetratricopeptide (TPR) repeat protein